MNTKIIIVGLSVALVVSGIFWISRPTKTEVREVVREEVKSGNLGALSSPDIISPYLAFGGVREWAYSMPMNTGSTTLCAFQAPQTGTTTLVAATANFNVGTTSATKFSMTKSGTPYATTTSLISGELTINAGDHPLIQATSTQQTMAIDYINQFATSTYLVVANSAAAANANWVAAGGTSPGTCKAVFREVI